MHACVVRSRPLFVPPPCLTPCVECTIPCATLALKCPHATQFLLRLHAHTCDALLVLLLTHCIPAVLVVPLLQRPLLHCAHFVACMRFASLSQRHQCACFGSESHAGGRARCRRLISMLAVPWSVWL